MKRLLLLTLCALGATYAHACELTPELWKLTVNAADSQGLDPHLLLALFWTESSWCHLHPETGEVTTSPKGALGLGQLMPATAQELGTDATNEAENAYGAAHYLKAQWETFQDWTLALAAYNAGPEAVTKFEGVPPFEETQDYVKRVFEHYEEFRKVESLALPEQREPISVDEAVVAFERAQTPTPADPTNAAAANVIYALLPTGDQKTPYRGVYLLPQTANGQTVYLMLEPQSFDNTIGVNDAEPAPEVEEFDPGSITFGRAEPEPRADNRE